MNLLRNTLEHKDGFHHYPTVELRDDILLKKKPNAIYQPTPDSTITQQYVFYDVSTTSKELSETRGLVNKVLVTDIHLTSDGEVPAGDIWFIEIKGLDHHANYDFKPSGGITSLGWAKDTIAYMPGQALAYPILLREHEAGDGVINRDLQLSVFRVTSGAKTAVDGLFGYVTIEIHVTKHY